MNEKNTRNDEILEEVKDTSDWTDDEGEVRELVAEDLKRMKPFGSLPLDLQDKLREIQKGNVVIRPDEEQVSIPISRSVVERFRASGDDWQARVDLALREWLDQHKAS